MCNIKQFGTGSDLIVHTPDIQDLSFSLYLSSTHPRYDIPCTPQKYLEVFFSAEFAIKSETNINNSMLLSLHLQHKFLLKMVSFMARFPHIAILWDKCHQTSILFMVV